MTNNEAGQSNSNMAPLIKGIAVVLVLVAAVAAIGAVARTNLPTADDGPQLTHVVRKSSMKVTVTENGMLESSNNKEIKCYVKGGSTVLWVIETGTTVKAGDELVKLDTSSIEDTITQHEITYETALANKIISESDVAVAEKSITEYLEGTYIEERSTIEKEIFDAEQALTQAELALKSSTRMAAKGLIKSLQLQGDEYAVNSARKELQLKKTRLTALEKYKKEKEMQTLQSHLKAAKARLASDEASLRLANQRLQRAKDQLENCIITTDTPGMVIFPSAADWKTTPDIEQGATVREQQTLLMIPDLSKMQVKVGVHESKVDRLRVGMKAKVQLQDLELEGEIESIAEVTKPAGWWTGNMVKYDTVIKLPPQEGLKPGMSAVVDIILSAYDDVMMVPVAALVESDAGYLCWVKTAQGIQRRAVKIGDTNDEFTVIESGLAPGDEVVLNPLAFVDEAQLEALKPKASATEDDSAKEESDEAKGPGDSAPDRGQPSADQTAGETKPKKQAGASGIGAQLVANGDKNKDGVLTEDEFREEDRANFSKIDSNGDGKVTPAELDAAIKKMQQARQAQ